MLAPEIVRELLDYDPDTGILRWKERSLKWFRDSRKHKAWHYRNQWNARYAGAIGFTAFTSDGYHHGCILSIQARAHRVAWCIYYGDWPSRVIDHINGNKIDNRI